MRSVRCPSFAVTGDATAAGGARWTYDSTDDGVRYSLEGILFAPSGTGPFAGIVLNHGKGGLPAAYAAGVGRVMAGWGAVVIGTRLTHAADADGRNATLLPAGPDGASDANVQRILKTRDLLSCLEGVDLARVAIHGHSMGAFATGQTVGRAPNAFRAASHTAGGTSAGGAATTKDAAIAIRTPYQIHHGTADVVVSVRLDEALDDVLAASGVAHELHRYPDYTHEQIAHDATMLERVRDWYRIHAVLP